RKDALVLQGAVALRMVGSVVCLLTVAGAIEGLVSASDAAPAYKFAVSGASAVLLVCHFASGWAYLRGRAGAAAPAAGATAATGTAPTWRIRSPRWSAPPPCPAARTAPARARSRPRCGVPGGEWR